MRLCGDREQRYRAGHPDIPADGVHEIECGQMGPLLSPPRTVTVRIVSVPSADCGHCYRWPD